MPIIRLHNPRRRKQRTARRRSSKRRNRNSLGEGVLTFMANPKRKRSSRRRTRKSYRRSNRNTVALTANPRRKRRRGSHRRRRNPVLNARRRRHAYRSNPVFPDVQALSMDALYMVGGGIVTRSLPQLVIPSYNVGWMGYLANLATTGITAAIIGRWRGAAASAPWLLGGVAFTLARVIDDYAGVKILSFAQYTPPFTLTGDASYGMRGIYGNYNFPLPSNSLGPRALPAPMVAENGVQSMAGANWGGSFN